MSDPDAPPVGEPEETVPRPPLTIARTTADSFKALNKRRRKQGLPPVTPSHQWETKQQETET